MEALVLIVLVLIGYYYFKNRNNKIDFSMLPEKFIVFDLETTGLNSKKHEIIEIGAIKVNLKSNNHETFHALIKPNNKIPKKITDITSITQTMVDSEGEELESVINEFIDFIGDLRLVAYNAKFDMGFLNEATKAQGKTIKNPVSCALKMARRAWPGLESYKLSEVAKIGGMSTKGSHRALKDCELTVSVYTTSATELDSAE